MSELLIAILVGVTMSLTGCAKAGESTVSDYEQGGYFQEEQQIEQHKEVDEPKTNNSTTHNNTTQPTKINDKQQTESKQNNNRTNTQHQYKKSTKGVDKVKRNSESSEEPKHNNQSTQENTQQEATDTTCTICGRHIYNGDDIVERDDFPVDDGTGHYIYGAFIAHKECYEREFGNGYRP